jgi:uncharacterized protein YecT (DUF1311 family)
MKKFSILLTTACLSLSANSDCKVQWCDSKKLSIAEQTICDSSSLRAADILLNNSYKKLLNFSGKEGQEGMWPREVKSNQLDWMKERNKLIEKNSFNLELDTSTQETIALNNYLTRITDLQGQIKDREAHSVNLMYQNMNDVYDAIVNNQPEDLVNAISFPTTIMMDKSHTFKTGAEFLAVYNKLVTEEFRKAVVTEKPSPKMFSNYQGRMIANGAVWFTDKGELKTLNFEMDSESVQ